MKKLVLNMALVTSILGAFSVAYGQETPKCALQSEGLVHAEWKKHRLLLNDQVVFGSNSLEELLETLQEFKASGRCY